MIKSCKVVLSKILPNWKELSYNFTPATVIRWQREGFKKHWKNLSKKNRKTNYFKRYNKTNKTDI